MGQVFISEILGTAMLLLLGGGVVANAILPKTKGFGGGFLMINFGWGLAVFAGVFVAFKSGAHINPAVTIGLLVNGADEFASGVDASLGNAALYILAQLIGAFIGAVLCWLAYLDHFAEEADPAVKLGVFSTGPELRNYVSNFITEVIGTFVLVFVVISFGNTPEPARTVGRRPARRRYRRQPRWPDRVRHQPGA